MSVHIWLASACLVAMGLSWSGEAQAYCRKRAIPLATRTKYRGKINKYFTDGVCEDDQIDEFKASPWVYWPNACTNFSVSSTLASTLSVDDAAAMAALAFSQWSGARCPSINGDARPSIDMRNLGQASCATVGYDAQGGPNQNLILFRQGWDALATKATKSDADTLGLTVVTYDDSGKILDADMQLNMQVNPAVVDPVAQESWDLRAILTHEIGHFLGFSHSGEPSAVMYYSAQAGETNKRYLADDDLQAICATYLPGGQRATDQTQKVDALPCDPTPKGGFTDECQAAPSKCSMVPSRGAPASSAVLALLALIALRSRRSASSRHVHGISR